jgi:hypothetical protein
MRVHRGGQANTANSTDTNVSRSICSNLWLRGSQQRQQIQIPDL